MKRFFIVAFVVAPLAFGCTPARQIVQDTPRTAPVYMASEEKFEKTSEPLMAAESTLYRNERTNPQKVELAYQPGEDIFQAKDVEEKEASSAKPYKLERVRTSQGTTYRKASAVEQPAPLPTNTVYQEDRSSLAPLAHSTSEQPIKMIAVVMSGDKMVITDEAILEQWEVAMEAVKGQENSVSSQYAKKESIQTQAIPVSKKCLHTSPKYPIRGT